MHCAVYLVCFVANADEFMYADNFKEAVTGRCDFEDIKYALAARMKCSWLIICSAIVMEKVCEYLYYHYKFRDTVNVLDMDIPPELCLELLMAADYLDGLSSDFFV